MVNRKCVEVIDGNSFRIDVPVNGSNVIMLAGVEKSNKEQKEKLKKMIEGKTVNIVV
jgi:hypothetical protein